MDDVFVAPAGTVPPIEPVPEDVPFLSTPGLLALGAALAFFFGAPTARFVRTMDIGPWLTATTVWVGRSRKPPDGASRRRARPRHGQA